MFMDRKAKLLRVLPRVPRSFSELLWESSSKSRAESALRAMLQKKPNFLCRHHLHVKWYLWEYDAIRRQQVNVQETTVFPEHLKGTF